MKRSTKTALIIIGLFLLLIISFIAIFYEIRKVPAYSWSSDYDYESKEPKDLWMFSELLKETFDSENVIFNKSDSLHINNSINNLYITAAESINYSEEEEDSLISFIKKGNDVLFITHNPSFKFPSPDSTFFEDDGKYVDDEEAIYYEEYEEEFESFNDSLSFEDQGDIIENAIDNLNELEPDTSVSTIISLNRYIRSFGDTVFHFAETPFDSIYGDYSYTHYSKEFKTPKRTSFRYLRPGYHNLDESSFYTPLAYAQEEKVFFAKFNLGEGAVYLHLAPELFVNVATRQEFYRDHYNKVMSNFSPSTVLVDKGKIRFNFNRKPEEKASPIQFILETPPLAWAYYITLASLLLFIIFRSKRLQRLIPTIEKNENTSLQYIKTLSTLYQSQNQNRKLVLHMRKVFFQKMKNKYYINPKSENYVELLAKKSKVEENEIELILHKFATARTSDYNDDQLIVLHRQLESFYKKAK